MQHQNNFGRNIWRQKHTKPVLHYVEYCASQWDHHTQVAVEMVQRQEASYVLRRYHINTGRVSDMIMRMEKL